LAKASVMAKFLIDAKVPLDDFWFNLADEEMAPCVMEVPQLWNERSLSKVHVKDGQIVNSGDFARILGVYGGVEMALPALPVAPLRQPAAPIQARAIRSKGLRVVSTRGPELRAVRFVRALADQGHGTSRFMGP